MLPDNSGSATARTRSERKNARKLAECMRLTRTPLSVFRPRDRWPSVVAASMQRVSFAPAAIRPLYFAAVFAFGSIAAINCDCVRAWCCPVFVGNFLIDIHFHKYLSIIFNMVFFNNSDVVLPFVHHSPLLWPCVTHSSCTFAASTQVRIDNSQLTCCFNRLNLIRNRFVLVFLGRSHFGKS